MSQLLKIALKNVLDMPEWFSKKKTLILSNVYITFHYILFNITFSTSNFRFHNLLTLLKKNINISVLIGSIKRQGISGFQIF